MVINVVKAVFTRKEISAYDDNPWSHYNFPKTYLNQVKQTVGDFIVYYEPRRTTEDLSSRGGKQSYFAVCTVTGIRPDTRRADHYFADVDDYVRFDDPVPFRIDTQYFEKRLKKPDGATNIGAFGRSVRLLPDDDFEQIVRAGFSGTLVHEQQESIPSGTGLSDIKTPFERPIANSLVSRPFRDRSFALQIQKAYNNRCAVTGLRITNGGGRPEIEAAHIKPIASHGPDAVQNGIALSRTAHWMFDRGLISISDDMEILRSCKYELGDADKLINSHGKLILPDDKEQRPHPSFLKFHRETVFEG